MQQDEKHRAEACKNLSPVGQKAFRLIEFDNKESLVGEIRKHVFGLIAIFVIGSFISFIVLAFSIIIASTSFLSDANLDGARPFIALLGFLAATFGIIMTVINMHLYRSNVVFVTNEKIAQVLYPNLLHRKISQLGMGDIQDVTVNQQGLFARLFGYGVLTIETAGEKDNYIFTYVPEPYKNSQMIIHAHEEFVKVYGN